jgi:hypothetical protein
VDVRAEINSLQRRLFSRQRRLIARSVLERGPALHRYEAAVQRRLRTFQREAAYGELLAAASTADLVYVGDYHTLKQAQRSFLKLVQRRTPMRPLTLAVEFVQGRHQEALDDYLAGRLGETEFLSLTEHPRHHVFGVWPNFKPIFEEARLQGLPMVAIDLIGTSRTTLAERDAYAAGRIARALAERPGDQVFVLAGQLHVAPPHLPAAVAHALRASPASASRRSALTIYQNADRIWFQQQRRGREQDVEAVLVRPGEWCLINTPPIVVQQSYLDWVEDGAAALEEGSERPEQRFKELVLLVARFLRLDGTSLREALEQVTVYTSGDLSFLGGLQERGFSAREIHQIERQIVSRESYFIPRAQLAYLATLSVNHAAEEATHFLRHVVSGAGAVARPLLEAFYARALEEAFAFCGSKIVNPRRKCPTEADWQRLSHRAPEAFTREVARTVVKHLRFERGELGPIGLRHITGRSSPELFNAVTHALGYLMGERLYYALSSGALKKKELRALFLDPLDDEGAPFLTYLDLVTRLRGVWLPARS